jgi:hypothetical protein
MGIDTDKVEIEQVFLFVVRLGFLDYQPVLVTFSACGPFGPSTKSNSTNCPS